MIKAIRADEIKVGTILAPDLDHGVMLVREVYPHVNFLNQKEVVVRGPSSIILKMHPAKLVKVLV